MAVGSLDSEPASQSAPFCFIPLLLCSSCLLHVEWVNSTELQFSSDPVLGWDLSFLSRNCGIWNEWLICSDNWITFIFIIKNPLSFCISGRLNAAFKLARQVLYQWAFSLNSMFIDQRFSSVSCIRMKRWRKLELTFTQYIICRTQNKLIYFQQRSILLIFVYKARGLAWG